MKKILFILASFLFAGEMEIDGTLYQSYESLIALGKQKISIELESKSSFLLTK